MTFASLNRNLIRMIISDGITPMMSDVSVVVELNLTCTFLILRFARQCEMGNCHGMIHSLQRPHLVLLEFRSV